MTESLGFWWPLCWDAAVPSSQSKAQPKAPEQHHCIQVENCPATGHHPTLTAGAKIFLDIPTSQFPVPFIKAGWDLSEEGMTVGQFPEPAAAGKCLVRPDRQTAQTTLGFQAPRAGQRAPCAAVRVSSHWWLQKSGKKHNWKGDKGKLWLQ